MKAELGDLTTGRDGKQRLTLILDGDIREQYDELSGKAVEMVLKKYHSRRTLTANAYAWVLIDKLAEKMGLTKTEIYRECIREIGGVSTKLCCPNAAVEKFRESWGMNGIGWFIETEPSKLEKCTTITAYYGSSTYDAKQMAALIDTIVQAAKGQGIETLPPAQLASMTEAWGKQYGRA